MADLPKQLPRSPFGEAARFLGIAFLGSWLVGGLAVAVLELGELGLGVGVLMVAVAALFCTRRDRGSVYPLVRDVLRWRFAARWYVVAFLLPFAALAAALLAGPGIGGAGLSSDAPGWTAVFLLPVFVLFLGGPEELGWRGYLLPRLQARMGALAATLVLGGAWMAWHAPAFLLSDLFANVPVIPYLVTGVASSVAYTWLYNTTGGSVLVAMLLHGSTNLSLAWLPQEPTTFGVYAGIWVLAATVLILTYGPEQLSGRERRMEGTDAGGDPASQGGR